MRSVDNEIKDSAERKAELYHVSESAGVNAVDEPLNEQIGF